MQVAKDLRFICVCDDYFWVREGGADFLLDVS